MSLSSSQRITTPHLLRTKRKKEQEAASARKAPAPVKKEPAATTTIDLTNVAAPDDEDAKEMFDPAWKVNGGVQPAKINVVPTPDSDEIECFPVDVNQYEFKVVDGKPRYKNTSELNPTVTPYVVDWSKAISIGPQTLSFKYDDDVMRQFSTVYVNRRAQEKIPREAEKSWKPPGCYLRILGAKLYGNFKVRDFYDEKYNRNRINVPIALGKISDAHSNIQAFEKHILEVCNTNWNSFKDDQSQFHGKKIAISMRPSVTDMSRDDRLGFLYDKFVVSWPSKDDYCMPVNINGVETTMSKEIFNSLQADLFTDYVVKVGAWVRHLQEDAQTVFLQVGLNFTLVKVYMRSVDESEFPGVYSPLVSKLIRDFCGAENNEELVPGTPQPQDDPDFDDFEQ